MICKKCHKDIPEGSVYCNFCGKKQEELKRRTRRGNGLGTAYKRGAYWQAEFTLGYYTDNDGKIRRKRMTKSGFKTKREALEYIDKLKTGKKERVINFETLWNSFKNGAYSELSKSKQTAYNIAWRKVRGELCFKLISELTTDELQDITDKYGTSYYTKRDIKNLLSHFYKIALRNDYVTANRASYIILPKLETVEREVFSPDEIEKIWSDFNTNFDIMSAHLIIMIYTGMRPGEILSALKTNVNFDEQYMIGGIKTEKGKNRKIIMPDKILTVVKFLINYSSSEKLSPYKDEDCFYDAWNKKKQELNLNKNLAPYCCRHTYVTNCTKLGMSPAMLQELTGHEDYDTTLMYTHLSVQDRLNEVNKL